ncbi:osteopontin [Latimeria chalumnae]|uniref:osteopontin n=1 Tax=Latimeria chalumnae TaxID=7897 RepID=UPI0003C15E2C|nr:PREDICTED: osteopontin [Latimeria chalumnae]|eukprot:XP_006007390.1 PREDICTED: osteopontin [Latimeria chalumnae]
MKAAILFLCLFSISYAVPMFRSYRKHIDSSEEQQVSYKKYHKYPHYLYSYGYIHPLQKQRSLQKRLPIIVDDSVDSSDEQRVQFSVIARDDSSDEQDESSKDDDSDESDSDESDIIDTTTEAPVETTTFIDVVTPTPNRGDNSGRGDSVGPVFRIMEKTSRPGQRAKKMRAFKTVKGAGKVENVVDEVKAVRKVFKSGKGKMTAVQVRTVMKPSTTGKNVKTTVQVKEVKSHVPFGQHIKIVGEAEEAKSIKVMDIVPDAVEDDSSTPEVESQDLTDIYRTHKNAYDEEGHHVVDYIGVDDFYQRGDAIQQSDDNTSSQTSEQTDESHESDSLGVDSQMSDDSTEREDQIQANSVNSDSDESAESHQVFEDHTQNNPYAE